MPGHDIVVVGASAGGVEALITLVRALPADLSAAVFVVLHLSPDGESALPQILSRSGALPAMHPQDGERITPGHIYVAPPDHHLLVERGHMRVVRGPRENRCRPAVDPLFRTAARAYGARVIAIVLSGMLGDGTGGLIAVTERGGISIVQDPADTLFAGMAESAIKFDHPAYILPVAEIGPLLVRLTHEAAGEDREVPSAMEQEASAAAFDFAAVESANKPGVPSVFGCPECGGVLWETDEGELIRYRCRVGHAFTADSLMTEQSVQLEAALWAALRGLEEKAALVHRLAEQSHAIGNGRLAARYVEQEDEARQHAAVIRELILHGNVSLAQTEVARQQESADG